MRVRSTVLAWLLMSAACATSRGTHASIRMADGQRWSAGNLNVSVDASYCHEDAEANCRRYGRLYTWESARRACESLGDGWRLPTSDEWAQMAKRYGGISDGSDGSGGAAFAALMTGGRSGFNAVLGGNRSPDGKYERIEAHGLYWTASEMSTGAAIAYNFGKGGQALHRGNQIPKQMALSARCIHAR